MTFIFEFIVNILFQDEDMGACSLSDDDVPECSYTSEDISEDVISEEDIVCALLGSE